MIEIIENLKKIKEKALFCENGRAYSFDVVSSFVSKRWFLNLYPDYIQFMQRYGGYGDTEEPDYDDPGLSYLYIMDLESMVSDDGGEPLGSLYCFGMHFYNCSGDIKERYFSFSTGQGLKQGVYIGDGERYEFKFSSFSKFLEYVIEHNGFKSINNI